MELVGGLCLHVRVRLLLRLSSLCVEAGAFVRRCGVSVEASRYGLASLIDGRQAVLVRSRRRRWSAVLRFENELGVDDT